jgi:tetratricopeptide (TPR) repeat protein
MKKHFAIFVFALLILGLCVPPAFTQGAGTVKGVCKDTDGKPIEGGVVVFSNQDTGGKVTVTTKKNGEYFSLGVAAGSYNVSLYKNDDDAKAGREMFHFNKFPVLVSQDNTLDFDLKKEQEKAPPGTKQAQDSNEKIKKDNITIKALNEKIVATNTAIKAGDYDTAVATMRDATQMDPSRDVLWGLLGNSIKGSALKVTDREEKTKRLMEAVDDYQKAIDIKQKALETAPSKKPEDAKALGDYYNYMGDALGRAGKIDDSVKAYSQAIQLNPDGTAGYYFNLGVVLTNAGKADAANEAFDKCLAADPKRAEAYYQKGVNLSVKETVQGGKTIAPPGMVEAFQKYLELSPTGQNAEVAKAMLASVGATVETGFGKKKAGK